MAPFYGWGWTASRLQNHYEKAVYFLLLSSQKFLVLIWSTSEGWKADSTLIHQVVWTSDPWIENPAPQPLGHCSIIIRQSLKPVNHRSMLKISWWSGGAVESVWGKATKSFGVLYCIHCNFEAKIITKKLAKLMFVLNTCKMKVN